MGQYSFRFPLGNEQDPELNLVWKEIKTIDMGVSFPLILRIYDDYTNGLITKKGFLEILKTTIGYVVRRSICDIPTNSLNKTFATFYQNIDKESYLKSVYLGYAIKETYREFPKDEDFVERFKNKDIYRMKIKNYILESLEDMHHKEPISSKMSEGIEALFYEIEDYILQLELVTKDFNKYYIGLKYPLY